MSDFDFAKYYSNIHTEKRLEFLSNKNIKTKQKKQNNTKMFCESSFIEDDQLVDDDDVEVINNICGDEDNCDGDQIAANLTNFVNYATTNDELIDPKKIKTVTIGVVSVLANNGIDNVGELLYKPANAISSYGYNAIDRGAELNDNDMSAMGQDLVDFAESILSNTVTEAVMMSGKLCTNCKSRTPVYTPQAPGTKPVYFCGTACKNEYAKNNSNNNSGKAGKLDNYIKPQSDRNIKVELPSKQTTVTSVKAKPDLASLAARAKQAIKEEVSMESINDFDAERMSSVKKALEAARAKYAEFRFSVEQLKELQKKGTPPEGFGICPICNGSGKSTEYSGWPCSHCAMYKNPVNPESYGFVELGKDGKPCIKHTYKITNDSKSSTTYTCTNCNHCKLSLDTSGT